MKKVKYIIPSALMLIAAAIMPGCNDEYDDVAPGNWVDTERIETFPGDTVLVTGTVSNGSPVSTVSLVCDAWNINQVYDRSSNDDHVFNYEYKLVVPEDAAFNQTLTVSVKCKNGKATVRKIPMSFLPDAEAPVVYPAIDSQIGLDFNTQSQKAVWKLKFNVTDDRALYKVTIAIPDIAYNESIDLKGRTGSVDKTIEFTAVGSYPCIITVYDTSGNQSVSNVTVMAMLAEIENPVKDYADGIYLVDANENPEDYVDGYYRWMDRKGAYQYEGKFYASTNNAKIYFTPERNLDGDLYGVSPYVSSKLMNNNGYVLPVTIEKAGYYGIWVDLDAHSYSIWALDVPTPSFAENLWLSGTGFVFGDWGATAEPMHRNGHRYIQTTEINGGELSYYFYTAGWADGFRADLEGKWWYRATEGSIRTLNTTYSGSVEVTLDTAYPWVTIKKSKQP